MRYLMLLSFQDGTRQKHVITEEDWERLECIEGAYIPPFGYPADKVVQEIRSSMLGRSAIKKHGEIIVVLLAQSRTDEISPALKEELVEVDDIVRLTLQVPGTKQAIGKLLRDYMKSEGKSSKKAAKKISRKPVSSKKASVKKKK